MVSQKYRWDFIGLSTDTKPTAETSEKVVNGSTYYCSDTSKLYVYCDGTWYERRPLGGGGGGGGSYTAGNGINITDETISVDTTTIQEKLTAGSNVTISDNTISATDTTYSNFTGTDGTVAGTAGLVPAPATTDAGKFLKADGTWDTAGGGSGPTVVQTTGASTTDVMSQNAVTSMVFAEPTTATKIRIGNTNAIGKDSVIIGVSSTSTGAYNTLVGDSAKATSQGTAIGYASEAVNSNSVAIGYGAKANQPNSIGFAFSTATKQGQMQLQLIGGQATSGYNNSAYRLISGVYDGQSAHDAATVAQGNTLATSAPTTSTVGVLGQLYTDTTNMHTYQCTAISGNTYTWTQRW